MGKSAEKLEAAISKVMAKYCLDKAFERGMVRDPYYGTTLELWRPKPDIIEKYYSWGESIVVAVLLDRFHDEYGLLDYLGRHSLDKSSAKNKRPAAMIWPGIDSFRGLQVLDNTLLEVVRGLIG